MKFLSRQRRFTTTLAVVLTMLFSQLALANYVCPGAPAPEQIAAMMVAGEPCSGMDEAAPVLCHQFGADATQSFEAAKLAAPTLPGIVQFVVLPVVLDSASLVALPFSTTSDARPPPEPVFLQTLRLRV